MITEKGLEDEYGVSVDRILQGIKLNFEEKLYNPNLTEETRINAELVIKGIERTQRERKILIQAINDKG